jgi:NAD(P)-dependent dehydrogenase (short-subunit alcohol dehydrogenase family)
MDCMSHALRGKSAFITGGTSGIGHAAAVEFARLGARVVVSGRRENQGTRTVELVRQAGGDARFVRTDVAVEDDVRRLVDATVSHFGRLDIPFNSAGVEQSPMAPVMQTSIDQYRLSFDANVLGVLLSVKPEIPAMLATGGGATVNTTSVAGHIGIPNAAT